MRLHKNGIFLIIVSNFFFAVLPIIIKQANQIGYSPMEETFFRFAFAMILIFFFWILGWASLKPVNLKVLLWRGFFGSASVIAYFIALQTTSAGKGTLLNYTYTIWANVFAVAFFKHKAPKGFFFILFLAIAGVWLVLDTSWGSFSWGDVAGIVSGLTGGAAVFAIQQARKTDNALTVFGSFTLFSFFISGAFLIWGHSLWPSTGSLNDWQSPNMNGWLILFLVGAVSMTAQMLFTQAFGYASLFSGTLLPLMVPVLAALFGYFFLNEPLTLHFLIGMILVLTACGMMIWREWV